jgi:hypothetical protein
MKLITVLGMLLQYFAFFFALPELLGQDRLIQLNQWFLKVIKIIPFVTSGLLCSILGLIMGVWGGTLGDDVSSTQRIIYYTVVISTLIFAILISVFQKSVIRFLSNRIANPLAKRLSESSDFRLRALKFAALFYTFGLALLIFAVLYY